MNEMETEKRERQINRSGHAKNRSKNQQQKAYQQINVSMASDNFSIRLLSLSSAEATTPLKKL